MKIKLFGERIDPACQYCEYGKLDRSQQMVLCKKRGSVSPYSSCRKFKYAPLNRIPRHSAPLPQYSKEDFML